MSYSTNYVRGECQVLLDDGTKKWLNADSRLKYPIVFNGVERKVILSERLILVPKNARPLLFLLMGDIIVLGTAFGIRAYPEEGLRTDLGFEK
ncbi:MAG: hypothetical protein ACLU4J_11750 [Butyricimonas paravirosa]